MIREYTDTIIDEFPFPYKTQRYYSEICLMETFFYIAIILIGPLI